MIHRRGLLAGLAAAVAAPAIVRAASIMPVRTPALLRPAELLGIRFKLVAANGGPASIKMNGSLQSFTVMKGDRPLCGGDLEPGQLLTFEFDGFGRRPPLVKYIDPVRDPGFEEISGELQLNAPLPADWP